MVKPTMQTSGSFIPIITLLYNFIYIFGNISVVWLMWLSGHSTRYQSIRATFRVISNINIFYTKFLQALAGNIGGFPDDVINCLSEFSETVPYDTDDIDDTFRQSITNLDSVSRSNNPHIPTIDIKSISESPVRMGTVSLVYDAQMTDGTHIAIKVLRKGIYEKIVSAIDHFDVIFNIISCIPYIRDLNTQSIYYENREIMFHQLDFNIELNNIIKMYDLNAGSDLFCIPTTFPEYTNMNSNIIVMKWIDGMTLKHVDESDKFEYTNILVQFGLKSIIIDGMYHGDMHSGNIRFSETLDGRKSIGLLDFGIVDTIDPPIHRIVIDFFTTLLDGDVDGVTNIICKRAILFTRSNLPIRNDIKLYREVRAIISETISSNNIIGINELSDINRILLKYDGRLRPDFCKINISLASNFSVLNYLLNGENLLDCIKSNMDILMNGDNLDEEGIDDNAIIDIASSLFN